jgi:hypothetical protein
MINCMKLYNLVEKLQRQPVYVSHIRRTVSQLQNLSFWVILTGGMPETISNYVVIAARGEKCRRSFDEIASPRPVVFPFS